jgi:hypothetical protein
MSGLHEKDSCESDDGVSECLLRNVKVSLILWKEMYSMYTHARKALDLKKNTHEQW